MPLRLSQDSASGVVCPGCRLSDPGHLTSELACATLKVRLFFSHLLADGGCGVQCHTRATAPSTGTGWTLGLASLGNNCLAACLQGQCPKGLGHGSFLNRGAIPTARTLQREAWLENGWSVRSWAHTTGEGAHVPPGAASTGRSSESRKCRHLSLTPAPEGHSRLPQWFSGTRQSWRRRGAWVGARAVWRKTPR